MYGALFRLLSTRLLMGREFAGHKILSVTKALESDSTHQEVLFPSGPEVRELNHGELEATEPREYPELRARFFDNALIASNPRVTAAIIKSRFVIPAVADEGPWKIDVGSPTRGGMKYVRDSSILVRVSERRTQIERGIFVGTWSPHNWFHWIVDTLPAVFLAQRLPAEYDGWPLLLPQSISGRRAWLEPLELVSNGRKVEFVLEPDSYASVSQLGWLDSPTSPGPISLNQAEEESLRVHSNALTAYRDSIIRSLGLELSPSPEKIFLARSQAGNRPYNQDALVKVASSFGFETVFLEDLSFSDSVRAVVSAKFIVGPHGAGWANSLFNTCGASALMWTWSQGPNRNWFANVAKAAGVDMKVIFTDSPASLDLKGETRQSSSHNLPENLFASAIEEMLWG